jgi:hypothetical protein
VRRSLVVLGAVALGAVSLASGGTPGVHVQPEPVFALPSTAIGCGGVTALAGGGARIPVTVSQVAGQVAETVNVCIKGQGPFPFVVDSGDGESTIDAGLAARLHLPNAGPAVRFDGVGCSGTARPVTVSTWSVEGEPLAGQILTAARLPKIGGRGEPDGLLGSDVLSTFGAVRLDFTAATLTFGGPQGSVATGSSSINGPSGPPPPALLTTPGPATTVPATTVLTPGNVSLLVNLRFGTGRSRLFAVDTGSSQTVVASGVAKAQHLRGSNQAQRQSTVCSIITTPLVHSGPWSIPGVALHQQLIDETDFGSISSGGLVGLLGSDQLIRYGWVVFDYRGGRLILG